MSPESGFPYERRISALRSFLTEQSLDSILISQPENRRYLSGFTGSSGLLLISSQELRLFADFRYLEQAEEEAPLFTLTQVRGDTTASVIESLSDLKAHRVGFEAQHVSCHTYQKWSRDSGSLEWVPLQGVVEKLRAVKDEVELAIQREAVALADAAMNHVLGILKPGMTERQVAWELESYLRVHGGERIPFDLIVASGPNASRPHAVTTDRILERGDPVVIDIGARVRGYCSDLTRTVCLGENERFLQLYEIVLEAQRLAKENLKAGVKASEVDAWARDFICSQGYGERFGHGLGHGVGLSVHEAPTLAERSEDVLEAGMVVTVEPGIYIPGWGGIRIEDMMVICQGSAEVLTGCQKRPFIDVK